MITSEMEDCLKAIYQLQEDDELVSTSALVDALGVTAPTVSAMTKKLDERGLVNRQAYKGVTLTKDGELIALEIVRHHRLIELFLTEHLDYDWAAVHEEADRLEHHISEEFEQKIADKLNDPTVDPHGAPIPSTQLHPIDDPNGISLTTCDIGDEFVVTQLDDTDPEHLAYLADVNVVLGTRASVVEIAPFGMMTVQLAETGEKIPLPEELATKITVKPSEQPMISLEDTGGVS